MDTARILVFVGILTNDQTGAIGYDDKQSSEERWAATGAVTLSEVVIYIYIHINTQSESVSRPSL